MRVVMAVEDEDVLLEMVAVLIENNGYRAVRATNGCEALTALQAEAELTLLIISDGMMPYMSGIELLQRLRSLPHPRATPVILISAGAHPQRALSNVTFAAKPFGMNEMLDLVVHSLHTNGTCP